MWEFFFLPPSLKYGKIRQQAITGESILDAHHEDPVAVLKGWYQEISQERQMPKSLFVSSLLTTRYFLHDHCTLQKQGLQKQHWSRLEPPLCRISVSHSSSQDSWRHSNWRTTARNSDTELLFHHAKCWIKHNTVSCEEIGHSDWKSYTKQILLQICPSSCWLTAHNLQKFKVNQFKWVIMMKAVLNCVPSPAFDVIFVTPSFCQAHVTEECA